MYETIINNTTVSFADAVPVTEETLGMCREFIDNRLKTPITAFMPTQTAEQPSIRLMYDNERENTADAAHTKLKIRDRDVDVYCFFGMKPEQLTESDKLFIEELLYEDVFVDVWDDGTPYIDD